jgi:hypothetical protein
MRSNGVRIEYLQLKVATFLLHVFNALVLLIKMQVIAFYLQSYLLQLFATNMYAHTHLLLRSESECVCVSTGAMMVMMMMIIIIIKNNFK